MLKYCENQYTLDETSSNILYYTHVCYSRGLSAVDCDGLALVLGCFLLLPEVQKLSEV